MLCLEYKIEILRDTDVIGQTAQGLKNLLDSLWVMVGYGTTLQVCVCTILQITIINIKCMQNETQIKES
jgi:hypothetical protein